MKHKTIENGRIDFNGFITSKIILQGENPHGQEEISSELIALLTTYRKDKHIPIICQEYDNFHTTESGLYQIETNLEIKYNSRPSDDPDLVNIGVKEYIYNLPLWYIVFYYLQAFGEQESTYHQESSLDSIKQKSSKELCTILQIQHKEHYINHDIPVILMGPHGMYSANIGG